MRSGPSGGEPRGAGEGFNQPAAGRERVPCWPVRKTGEIATCALGSLAPLHLHGEGEDEAHSEAWGRNPMPTRRRSRRGLIGMHCRRWETRSLVADRDACSIATAAVPQSSISVSISSP